MLICVSVHGCDSGMPYRPNHPLFRVQFDFLYGAPLSADDGSETLVFFVQPGQLSKMFFFICCFFRVRIMLELVRISGKCEILFGKHTEGIHEQCKHPPTKIYRQSTWSSTMRRLFRVFAICCCQLKRMP